MNTTPKNYGVRASFSIFISAAFWGLFWIPMRYFDEAGLTAFWAVAAINFCASIIAVPAAILAKEIRLPNLKWLLIIGFGMGISNVFYFAGLILSDVIRVTFLFYLLPIWATVLSKLIFNVTIGPVRMMALGLAIIGIWLLLGAGGWPVPQNTGDVFGLLSGLGWAFGLTMIRGKEDMGAFATGAFSHVFAFAGAMLLGLLFHVTFPEIQPGFPSLETIARISVPLVAFSVVVMWPTEIGQLWGAKYVAATTAALLTMSEIVMATVSAGILIGSELTAISWLGGCLILLAILVDLFAPSSE